MAWVGLHWLWPILEMKEATAKVAHAIRRGCSLRLGLGQEILSALAVETKAAGEIKKLESVVVLVREIEEIIGDGGCGWGRRKEFRLIRD